MQDAKGENKKQHGLIPVTSKLPVIIAVMVIVFILVPFTYYYYNQPVKPKEKTPASLAVNDSVKTEDAIYWKPNDVNTITDSIEKNQVVYGRELIAHTAKYFGPKGSVLPMSNGLNCQNCHLQAGTAVFGNNFGSVASLYPKFRARSGSIENIYKRVNDCFERSLHGKVLDTTSREMQAIVSYINFIGANVEKGKKAEGSGFRDLEFLDRAADTVKGRAVYIANCQKCHQPNGDGVFNQDNTEYTYPALWGKNSFTDAAGLFRISNFAKFVKYNMPQGTTFEKPQLTDEEAWDGAAFILTQRRPHINEPKDWPDKKQKPVDHPYGPYADTFSEMQHKYGPFKPMVNKMRIKN
jgi:thiosulfate dehydrogenase